MCLLHSDSEAFLHSSMLLYPFHWILWFALKHIPSQKWNGMQKAFHVRAMALLCVHMSDISEEEQRHISWASWGEKTVHPSTSNTAPPPHTHTPPPRFNSERSLTAGYKCSKSPERRSTGTRWEIRRTRAFKSLFLHRLSFCSIKK